MIKKFGKTAIEPQSEKTASGGLVRERAGLMRRPGASRPEAVSLRPAAEAPPRPEKSLESLGNLLKTKREINGLTRRDVVVKIKIPLEQLESIEDGRLSSLPPVFAKGFLRAYANELGLDAEAILDDYRKMTGGFKNEPASREPLAPRYVETSVGSVRWRPSPRMVVTAVLIVAAISAGSWIWPGLKNMVSGFLPGDDSPAVEAAAETSSASVVPGGNGSLFSSLPAAASSGGAGLPATAPALSGENIAVATGTLSKPSADISRPPAASSAPRTLDGPTALRLTSKKDRAWVEVVVDGQAPEFFLFTRNGQYQTWVAEESIVVTSGNANILSVNWDDRELGELSGTPVAKVRFP